jgi:hypothetical protein
MPITTQELREKMVTCLNKIASEESVSNTKVNVMIHARENEEKELETLYFYTVNNRPKLNEDGTLKYLDFGTEVLCLPKAAISVVPLVRKKVKEARAESNTYLIGKIKERSEKYGCGMMDINILLIPTLKEEKKNSVDFKVNVLNRGNFAETNLTLEDVFGS